MSDKTARIVRSPYDEAARFLNAYIATHREKDGSARIGLCLPIGIFAKRRTVDQRRLYATLYPLHTVKDRHQVYSVTWPLQTVGAFPEFNGALAIERGTSDATSVISVRGNYELLPYAGAAEVTLFQRVAHAAARELLRTIAEHVENACAHDFAARAGYSKPMRYAVLSMSNLDSDALRT